MAILEAETNWAFGSDEVGLGEVKTFLSSNVCFSFLSVVTLFEKQNDHAMKSQGKVGLLKYT